MPNNYNKRKLNLFQENVEEKTFSTVYSESYSNLTSEMKYFHSITLKISVLN